MSKQTNFNADNILLLEQSLLKVPQEQLKRNLRTTQRLVERDFTSLSNTLSDLSSGASGKSSSGTDASRVVESMLTRMRGLKRKLDEVNSSNTRYVNAVQKRAAHIDVLTTLDISSESGDQEYTTWSSVRLSRQIVEYLLRRGFLDSASRIARTQEVTDLVDEDLFRDCSRIEKALEEEKVAEALNWCKENQSALKKAKSTLEFDLRYQEFIELIRSNQASEAIAHSRKYLVPWSSTHLPQIKQAMVLLAFGSETTCSPYTKFFSPTRWMELAIKFRYTLLSVHSISPLPMLILSLQTGLAALKTPTCFSSASHSHNLNCPTCSPLYSPLAQSKQVPFSHHANSIIVCKITNKVMGEGQDEGRMPWVLPNGMVYSREGLEFLVSQYSPDEEEEDEDGGASMLVCPRTGDRFDLEEAVKVYIS